MSLFRRRRPDHDTDVEANEGVNRGSRHSMWQAMKLQRAINKARKQRARREPITALPPHADLADVPSHFVSFTRTEDGGFAGMLAVTESRLMIVTESPHGGPTIELIAFTEMSRVSREGDRLDFIIDGRPRSFAGVEQKDQAVLIEHVGARL